MSTLHKDILFQTLSQASLKACTWFCLKNGFFNRVQSDDPPDVYTLEGSGKPSGKVQKCHLDVSEKGTKKVAEKFLGLK